MSGVSKKVKKNEVWKGHLIYSYLNIEETEKTICKDFGNGILAFSEGEILVIQRSSLNKKQGAGTSGVLKGGRGGATAPPVQWHNISGNTSI